jgi:hypothetical protein
MDTKDPQHLGKEIGKRQWHTARVKRFLGEPPRRFRLVAPSLADYIDDRLERIDLPDPLPPVTGKDNHRGTVVWGERTWDLPAGPDEARGTPAKKSPHAHYPRFELGEEGEAAWIATYRAAEAALSVGLFRVGSGPHTSQLTDPVEIKEGGEVMMKLDRDAVAVCSARPLSEDEHGRVPSYLADVIDATLYTIHRRAVQRQIQRARSHYRHAPVTPAVDRQTGEILNIGALRSEPRLDSTCPA